jgi:ribose transport system ATP-binding protein
VSGTLSVNGKSAIIKDPCDAMHRYGIAYISENRNEEGVFVSHELATNISASVLSKISGLLGLVRCKAENNLADSFIQRLSIKTPHRRQLVVNLSGGNRQKVSVAKILAAEPKILIFDEPSVGIDIKTKDEIHDMIVELARSGISIILISSDMKEMIKVADRIAVFHEAKLLCDMPNNKRYAEMSERIIRTIMGKQM